MIKKKILAFAMAVLLVMAVLPTASLAAFPDVSGHWAQEAIDRWADYAVINGYEDGSFKPDNNMTRGEFFKVINSIFNFQETAENTFTDLSQSNWYYDVVLKLVAAGIVQGDGSTVRGNDLITRQEAFAVYARIFGVTPNEDGLSKFTDADSVSAWARAEVGGMAAAGFIQGSGGLINAGSNIKRGEVLTVSDNIVKGLYNAPGTYTADVKGIAVVNTAGVVLQGKVDGDLYITPGINSGSVNLSGLTVTGTVYVYGDATVTVDKNSTINNVKVIDDNVNLVVDGKVTNVSVDASVVRMTGNGTIATVNILSGTGNSVTVKNAKVTVAEGAGEVSIGDGKYIKPGSTSTVSTGSGSGTSSSGGGGSSEPDATTYSVMFVSDGEVLSNVRVAKNALVGRPADPVREGFVFDGWFKEDNFVTLWDFDNDRITGATTIYAKWIPTGGEDPGGPGLGEITVIRGGMVKFGHVGVFVKIDGVDVEPDAAKLYDVRYNGDTVIPYNAIMKAFFIEVLDDDPTGKNDDLFIGRVTIAGKELPRAVDIEVAGFASVFYRRFVTLQLEGVTQETAGDYIVYFDKGGENEQVFARSGNTYSAEIIYNEDVDDYVAWIEENLDVYFK